MKFKKEIDANLLIYAGLAIGGYFAIAKVLKGLGFLKSDEQIAAEKLAAEARQKFIDDAQAKPDKKQTAGGTPTKSDATFGIMANQFYEYLKYSKFDDNKKAAFEMLYTRIQNDADIAKMMKYFGLRQEYAFGIPVGRPKDFNQFVTSNLSKTQIDLLNQVYQKSKMKIRF